MGSQKESDAVYRLNNKQRREHRWSLRGGGLSAGIGGRGAAGRTLRGLSSLGLCKGGVCGRRETGRDAGLREEPVPWRFLVNPVQSLLSVLLFLGHMNRLFIHTDTHTLHTSHSHRCADTRQDTDSHKLTNHYPPLLKRHALLGLSYNIN